MTQFLKVVDQIIDDYVDELYNGDVQILIVKNASDRDIHKFGELEHQDLYGEKEVPIGTDDKSIDHVWQEVDMMWHSDRAYLSDVHPFCGLYCSAADEGSSPTYFCNNITGWKNLDKDLQERIKSEGPVQFTVKNYFEKTTYPHDFRTPVWERAFKIKSKTEHELYKNDKFGEYIFFSEAYAKSKYADEITEKLFNNKENLYTHIWEPGDLVVWNNFTTTHRRDHTPSNVRRRLMRYAFHRSA